MTEDQQKALAVNVRAWADLEEYYEKFCELTHMTRIEAFALHALFIRRASGEGEAWKE